MPRDVVPFYHYTNDRGLEGILREGRIGISDPNRGDALEGPGTYGTKYPPSTRSSTIARNNWDDGWKIAMEHDKMKNYVRCEIPRKELKECRGHGGPMGGRKDGILVHTDGIDLSKYPTKFGRVGEDDVRRTPLYNPAKYYNRSQQIQQPGQTSGQSMFAPPVTVPYPQSNTWCHSDSDTEPQNCGHNAAGNYYESFSDGSYRYENSNGSTYAYDSSSSHAVYTAPDGAVTEYNWDGPNSGDGNSEGQSDGHSQSCDDGGEYGDYGDDYGDEYGEDYDEDW